MTYQEFQTSIKKEQDDLRRAKSFLDMKTRTIQDMPKIGIILGSGLSSIYSDMQIELEIPYKDIPGFGISRVDGHGNTLVFGKFNEVSVIVMNGRYHTYEGWSSRECAYPIKVMKQLGVETLIVTNAAGSTKKDLGPGDIMFIKDHLSFFIESPLTGEHKFVDMTTAYDKELLDSAMEIATELEIKHKDGIYCAKPGPEFETSAEIKIMANFADAMGMSTIPETTVARSLNMKILGISYISNYGAGIAKEIKHADVLRKGKEAADKIKAILYKLLPQL